MPDVPEEPAFNDPRRWAGRLAFPAAAAAVVLALRAVREPGEGAAWWVAATLAGVVALVLLRLRTPRRP